MEGVVRTAAFPGPTETPSLVSNIATYANAVSRKKSASWPSNVNARRLLIHQCVYADKHKYIACFLIMASQLPCCRPINLEGGRCCTHEIIQGRKPASPTKTTQGGCQDSCCAEPSPDPKADNCSCCGESEEAAETQTNSGCREDCCKNEVVAGESSDSCCKMKEVSRDTSQVGCCASGSI